MNITTLTPTLKRTKQEIPRKCALSENTIGE